MGHPDTTILDKEPGCILSRDTAFIKANHDWYPDSRPHYNRNRWFVNECEFCHVWRAYEWVEHAKARVFWCMDRDALTDWIEVIICMER